MAWNNCIALVDMIAFFPSCEQLDFPELVGKPLAVTNGDAGTTIISSSYEARAFGVKTGMHMNEAIKLCPDIIKRSSRPKRYAEISAKIMSALKNITPDIEIFSIDECWIDLKPILSLYGGIDSITKLIRGVILESSGGIRCSIGVSSGKLTAKFVAGVNKGETTVVSHDKIKEYMAGYPVSKMCGIGKMMQEYLTTRRCFTIGDVQQSHYDLLSSKYGVVGKKLQLACNGVDNDPVITKERLPKSMGHSKVLPPATIDRELVTNILLHLTYRLTRRMRLLNITSKNVRIYFFTKYDVIKNSYEFDKPNNCNREFIEKVRQHLKLWKGQSLFQIGVKCHELIHDNSSQQDLFDEPYNSKYLTVDRAMDNINKKFGTNTCKHANELILDEDSVIPVIAFNFDATSNSKNSL